MIKSYALKNIIKYTSIFILASVIIAGGTAFIFRAKLIAYFVPSVDQVGDIHIFVKNDTSYVNTILVVKNHSFLKIEMDTIRYKVSLFDKTYLQNEQSLGVQLPGYGNDTVNFSLKIPSAAIIKDIKAERKKDDSASYSINVSLQYTTAFGTSEIPITKSAKLKIPQPPELKVMDIKWKKVRFKSIHALANIKIINYSPVTLAIKELSYSMNILNHGNLKGTYKKLTIIKPHGTTFIDLPLEINVEKIGKTLFQILINKDNYNYVLTLNALIASSYPMTASFQINMVKTGHMELKK